MRDCSLPPPSAPRRATRPGVSLVERPELIAPFPAPLPSRSPPRARSSISSKAAGAAAALFLMASPAALADGLTVNTVTGAAPGKYQQPFADLRPIVEPELDSSADISTEAARVSANKQVGLKNCKTITGAPCTGSEQITMQ